MNGESGPLLTMQEVSAITTLAKPTLYAMRSRGEGPPSFLVANRVRYRPSAVEAWLAAQEEAEADRLARIGA
jgi:predicted DNA-binding transcriptional regulator AlpA